MKVSNPVLIATVLCAIAYVVQCADEKDNNWRLVGSNKLISVSAERVLYEHESKKSFCIHVRITNVSQKDIGVDLRDYWTTLYPNQWGVQDRATRQIIDEESMIRHEPDAAKKAELTAAFEKKQLTVIPAGTSTDYYREFNASGLPAAKAGEFLIISLDGQILSTDGKGVEDFQRKNAGDWDLIIKGPLEWRVIPKDGLLVKAK
jgi:hypothetical protein